MSTSPAPPPFPSRSQKRVTSIAGRRFYVLSICLIIYKRTVVDFRCVPPTFSPSLGRTHDCAAVFTEWVDLRCQTLLRAGASPESARLEALVSQSPHAWEKLVESSAMEDLEGIRSKLVALRDAVLFGPPALNGIDFEALEAMESGHTSWGGSADAMPLWWAHSQSGCSIEEVI